MSRKKKKRPLRDTEWNRRSFAKKFWARVDVRGEDECWPWRGRTTPQGYGMAYCPLATFEGGQRAHRLVYFLTKGHPGDLIVCHRCDTPSCCNPDHLVLGTHSDNMRDMVSKGRGGSAKLQPPQVLDIRDRLNAGEDPRDLSEEYGVRRSTILAIRDGTRWSAVIEGFDLQAAEQPPRPQPPQPPLPTLPEIPLLGEHPVIRAILDRRALPETGTYVLDFLQLVAIGTANHIPRTQRPQVEK